MTVIIKSTESVMKINLKLKDLPNKGKFKAHKYCGKLNLKEDPIFIQRIMRDEWQ
jgi:hypothetical protein